MSSRAVKEYLSNHHLSQLLESLLTGLLYHHPEDPISFLQTCLITTRQLGGPESIFWDTFIHLERHQLSPSPPRAASVTPTTPGPMKTTSKTPITAQMTTPPLPSIPLTTPSISPVPQLTPLRAQNYIPTAPLAAHVLSCNNKPLSGPPQTSPEPRCPPKKTPGPAVAPPVHSERKQQQDTRTFSTDAPGPGPGPLLIRAQLSIDSDSDMTESSGLRQEVSVLPPQTTHPVVIFIIGGPGSGKGSQAARLAHCFGFRVISLDELLRRQLLSHTSPRRKWEVISEMMGHGELGPQEETISELRRQLIGQLEVTGFIVDGFPRDIHQALSFQDQFGSPDLVMLLLCSNETLRCRLQQRAAHLGLLGDNSHALRRRLETFQRDVISISRYYRQLDLLAQVDADRHEEVVFADLNSAIREKLHLKDPSDLQSVPDDIPECHTSVPAVSHHTCQPGKPV